MYSDLEAQLHDVFWNAEGTSAELPLIKKFLDDYSGGKAMEIGCGSGRLLIPLLKKGYTLDGLDASEEMLAMCRESTRGRFPDVNLFHADMLGYTTEEKFAAITIPAFTLQFLSHDQLPIFFNQINNMLDPNGGLYLSVFIPWAEITGELEEDVWFSENELECANGDRATCKTRFNIQRLSQKLTREHRYTLKSKAGETRKTNTHHHLHWFWLNELSQYLQAIGFKVKQVIGDFEVREEPDENAHTLTIIAEKTV